MSSGYERFEVEGDTHEGERNYDAARAESDLAFIAKKRREIEWWQHNIAAAEEKIARAEERLKAFAIAYRQTVGGSQISLANGFIAANKAREKTEIFDPAAWRKWRDSKAWPPDFYDKPALNDSKVKSVLVESTDGGFLYEMEENIAGQPVVEVVPGIRRLKPGPLDFNVKINAGRTINEETPDDDESE